MTHLLCSGILEKNNYYHFERYKVTIVVTPFRDACQTKTSTKFLLLQLVCGFLHALVMEQVSPIFSRRHVVCFLLLFGNLLEVITPML